MKTKIDRRMPAESRNLFSRRRTERRFTAIALLAVMVAIASCVLFASMQEQAYDSAHAASAPKTQTSTPMDQWAQGEVPMLLQTDPAWANEPYAGSDVQTAGCGPTCLTMVYIALTGKRDMTPADMAAFSERNGFVEAGMTSWALMTQGASSLGLASEELPADAGALRDALAAGHPVIASVMPGDFTTTGHFIVIAGENADGGLVVRDPNSAERSAQAWDAQRVLSQCANLWAFSA